MIYVKKLTKQDVEKEFAIQFGPSVDFFHADTNNFGDFKLSFKYNSPLENDPLSFHNEDDVIVANAYFNKNKNEIRTRAPFNSSYLCGDLDLEIGDILIFSRKETTGDSIKTRPSEIYFFAVKNSSNNFSRYEDLLNHNLSSQRNFIDAVCDVSIETSLKSDTPACSSVCSELDFNTIFYGAPGTGKSNYIKNIVQLNSHQRTTFHPDSDYSSFVGSYKPISREITLPNGQNEYQILYSFVAQSFVKSYISAWLNYPKLEFLIIEEINRGNCAQIFGDLFQILDRKESGFSEYPISSDSDLGSFLKHAFENDFSKIEGKYISEINSIFSKEYSSITEKIKEGELVLLPNNLYILSTMNTSDQSLFPIDSAFKRRWDWQYVPITLPSGFNWYIDIDSIKYNWWSFVTRINSIIYSTTNSEDKQIGFFFVKAKKGIISSNTFLNKVIFYLWNDVFKDYELDEKIFYMENGEKLSFASFFDPNGKIISDLILKFLDKLEVEKEAETVEISSENEEYGVACEQDVIDNSSNEIEEFNLAQEQDGVESSSNVEVDSESLNDALHETEV